MRKTIFFLCALMANCASPLEHASLNVLFITLDDLNWDSVGVYGSKVPDITPNIDRLAAEGMRFEHAHVTIAICQPTRAVWMTGRYPHRSGALGFDPIHDDVPTRELLLAHMGKTEDPLSDDFSSIVTGKKGNKRKS